MSLEFEEEVQEFSDWVKNDCLDGDHLLVGKNKEGFGVLYNKRTNQVYVVYAELPNIIEKIREGVEL